MTDATSQTAPPAARTEPAYRPSYDPPPPVRPLPLGYEPPQAKPPPVPFEDVLVFLFRRAVFALGAGLLTYGLVAALATRTSRDGPFMAGWGAGLIALVVPFPALWRHWPTRR